MTTPLEALTLRVETEEPSLELGAQVICAIRQLNFLSVESRGTELNPSVIAVTVEKDGVRYEFWTKNPLLSFDAAVSLVPEDCRWSLSVPAKNDRRGHKPSATCHAPDKYCRVTDIQSAFPAQALTAAALRAIDAKGKM